MRRFNILMVTETFLPYVGGSQTVVLEISKRLVQKGHKVFVLTSKHLPDLADTESLKGIHIFRYPVNSKHGLLYYVSLIMNAKKMFEHIVKENPVDLIHFHITLPSIGVLLSAKSKNISKICTYYECWCDEFLVESRARKARCKGIKKYAYSAYTKLLYYPMKFLQRRVVKKSSVTIALSNSSAKSLQILMGRGVREPNILILPGGADILKFRPTANKVEARKKLRLNSQRFICFTVRRLVPRMGLADLIRAFHIIVDHNDKEDIQLIIGGEGILKDKLEDLIACMGLEKYVKLVGHISDDQLPLYYQASDAFILPTKALEGFGLVTVEAMASGLPVLATPIGANPELIERIGQRLLFAGCDALSIAEGIQQFQVSDWNNTELSERCRKQVFENYSWDRIADKYVQAYSSIIEA